MQFWDCDEGCITLVGDDIRDYRLDDLRFPTALVAQDIFLFNNTLKTNFLIVRTETSPRNSRCRSYELSQKHTRRHCV